MKIPNELAEQVNILQDKATEIAERLSRIGNVQDKEYIASQELLSAVRRRIDDLQDLMEVMRDKKPQLRIVK